MSTTKTEKTAGKPPETDTVDLKTKTIADLLKMAEDLDIPGVSEREVMMLT